VSSPDYRPKGNVEKFSSPTYLGTTVTNQNRIHDEMKSRLSSGNACCRAVQNLLSSSALVSENMIKIYKTIILPLVLYGCEALCLTLKEEYRLWVLENRMLRRKFESKRKELAGR
jgi:hypothetical protein